MELDFDAQSRPMKLWRAGRRHPDRDRCIRRCATGTYDPSCAAQVTSTRAAEMIGAEVLLDKAVEQPDDHTLLSRCRACRLSESLRCLIKSKRRGDFCDGGDKILACYGSYIPQL